MSDETVREDWNATVREGQNAAATLREGQAAAGAGGIGAGATFQGYRVVRQLPSKGSEADIFVVEKDAAQYILKQYRYGINPKRDILLAIKALSESHPHEFVRLFDADFDAASGRWYEIQEYVPNGSLQSLMADRSLLTGAQQATFFTDVVRELADDLNALHQNNLLHLDLKPSNILLRSIHPLNLVLIDFGIATSLASDMSKKFTQVRGTPMYQSPESYSGGMGRPADWWGLGMILLEIAAGAHPFKGLSNNIIAYAISTEPVPVPEDLDAGRKELLQGLLTRDPEKRWSYEQVVRWLSGERSIPQHFETAPAMQAQPAGNASLKPLKFMDRQYQSLAELAAAFLKDEPSWEKGKGFLIRGYVRQWLEKNEEFDAIMDIDAVLSGAEDPDEKVFCFVQRFGGDMPFAFGGHLITLENLLLFAGKVLKRQPVTAMEQKIVDSIANGILLSCLDFYKQQGRVSGTVRDLEPVLKTLEGKTWEQIVKILDIFIHPENSGMTIQEIAKRIEEQERKEQQERLEREKREQERKEQQERLEREKKERERREQQERLALKASFLNVSVGSTVKFGHYEQDNNTSNGKEEIEWRVLAVKGNRALIISEYGLDCQPYDSTGYATWEVCTLRTWLNDTFYNAAFGTDHQKMIVHSTVIADKNSLYHTLAGNNTTDKVFLLSITEVNRYFSSNGARQCRGTAYCYARGACKGSNGNCCWWLRSPGRSSNLAAFVNSDGSVRGSGYGVRHGNFAVRPALWINLGS